MIVDDYFFFGNLYQPPPNNAWLLRPYQMILWCRSSISNSACVGAGHWSCLIFVAIGPFRLAVHDPATIAVPCNIHGSTGTGRIIGQGRCGKTGGVTLGLNLIEGDKVAAAVRQTGAVADAVTKFHGPNVSSQIHG